MRLPVSLAVEHLKEAIAVFISNAISDHEMSFEINPLTNCCANQLTGFYMRATLALNGLSIPSSIISGSNWENLKHIKLQPNLPVCL